jgi:hypothetical protein
MTAGSLRLLKSTSLSLEGSLRGILNKNMNQMDLSRPLTRQLIFLEENETSIPWQRLRLMEFRDRYNEFSYDCKEFALHGLPETPNALSFDDFIEALQRHRAAIIKRISDLTDRYSADSAFGAAAQ